MLDLARLRGKAPPRRPATGDELFFAIGDIHGRYDLLVTLLARIVADANDRSDGTLIFLGDYVDRGPATAEVLAGLIWIERHAPLPSIFLKGNHEQVMLDYIDAPVRHRRWLDVGGIATLRSYGVPVPDDHDQLDHLDLRDQLVDRLPSSHLDFLRRLRLFHEAEDYIFVHAGIQPGIPMAQQDPEDLLWIRDGFLAERAAGAKRIVHGHTWVSDKPEVLTHRIGVDTGAYETGVLTAARLCGSTVDFISTAASVEHGEDMPTGQTERVS